MMPLGGRIVERTPNYLVQGATLLDKGRVSKALLLLAMSGMCAGLTPPD